MEAERRSRSTLSGFVLGVTGTGITVSSGILTLIIVLNRVARDENGIPSLSSQLMIALCSLIMLMGILVLLGSLGIWKLSVRGAGVNLGIGFVLLALAQGLLILLSDFVASDTSLATYLGALYYVMGIAPTLSGMSGLIAYFTRKKE